jgi:UDP-N-acetyl-2-amino-2-deoxyglucuronate dehydrogenase
MKMKVAQIGVGNFGARRRQLMRESGLFELVSAYDLNPAAMEQCRKEDGARPVASYVELLATPGIEAVVISTGATFHAEQMIAAAEKGLHVFVEKPLCSTPKEVLSLLAVQRKTGVVIGLGHADHRHDALSLRIKELIDSNELGTIATFEKTTAHNGGLQIKPGDWRGDPAKNPGGMLFQCGVHAVHELMFYFGPIVEVSAKMRYDVHTTQTADVALCHLTFASGLIGTLNAYHVTPYRHTFNILGTKANLYRDERFFDEGTTLQIQRTGVPGAKEPKEPVAIDKSLTDECGGMRSFYEAVRQGGACYPSLIDGARAVAVVFAAEESARCGRPVAVPDGAKGGVPHERNDT